jgi:hypothetical protein
LDGSDDDSPTCVVRLPTPNADRLRNKVIDLSLLDESIWTESELNDSMWRDKAVYEIKNSATTYAESILIDDEGEQRLTKITEQIR